MSRQAPPLVFIHGFKGCYLQDSVSSKQHWLTGSQALGLSNADVSLPLTWQGDVQGRDKLVPGEPLRKVLYASFYGPFIDWCEQRLPAFYSFSYDWRRDNAEAVVDFSRYLRAVSKKHNGQAVQVIAHSNGGLITYVTWKQHPELFHSMLFAGTPFRGGIGVMKDLHHGLSTGFNRKISGPSVRFSYVTPYVFFPLSDEPSHLFAANGAELSFDWFDLANWEALRLGLFGRGQVDSAQRRHLVRALQRCKVFREQLIAEETRYPPIAVIASGDTPTLAALQLNTSVPAGWDFDVRPKEPGDGRVRLVSSKPPEGVPFTLYETRHQHTKILLDIDVVHRAVEGLLAAGG